MSTPEHNADQLYHVWINRRQDERRKAGAEWEGSLYEFKSMLNFLSYGHDQIRKAVEGRLPATHRQCSRCEPEPVENNRLMCCLGKDVLTCPILCSLKATIEEERYRVAPYDGEKHYANVDDEQLYRLMARTCAWHIYHEETGIQDGHHFQVDTSEGYLLDKTDRIFWDRVYTSLAGSDPDGAE
jgi:hypothetical protein